MTTQFKCVACRARMRIDAPCPVCGGGCEPADDLAELVGFRLVGPHEQLVEQIRSALAADPGAT